MTRFSTSSERTWLATTSSANDGWLSPVIDRYVVPDPSIAAAMQAAASCSHCRRAGRNGDRRRLGGNGADDALPQLFGRCRVERRFPQLRAQGAPPFVERAAGSARCNVPLRSPCSGRHRARDRHRHRSSPRALTHTPRPFSFRSRSASLRCSRARARARRDITVPRGDVDGRADLACRTALPTRAGPGPRGTRPAIHRGFLAVPRVRPWSRADSRASPLLPQRRQGRRRPGVVRHRRRRRRR